MKNENRTLRRALWIVAAICFTAAGLLLAGCGSSGSSVTYEPCPPEDASAEAPVDDAGRPPRPAGVAFDADGNEVARGYLHALDGCTWIGGIHARRRAAGELDCAPEPCPFPYDPSGREEWVCTPQGIADCATTIESVNGCDAYRVAMNECSAHCGIVQ